MWRVGCRPLDHGFSVKPHLHAFNAKSTAQATPRQSCDAGGPMRLGRHPNHAGLTINNYHRNLLYTHFIPLLFHHTVFYIAHKHFNMAQDPRALLQKVGVYNPSTPAMPRLTYLKGRQSCQQCRLGLQSVWWTIREVGERCRTLHPGSKCFPHAKARYFRPFSDDIVLN